MIWPLIGLSRWLVEYVNRLMYECVLFQSEVDIAIYRLCHPDWMTNRPPLIQKGKMDNKSEEEEKQEGAIEVPLGNDNIHLLFPL